MPAALAWTGHARGTSTQNRPRALESGRDCAQRLGMLRAKPNLWWALGASLSAACLSPEPPTETTASAPLIGRLQDRDGVVDLTVHSFGEGPHAVPTSSYARVMADIAPDVRGDGDRKAERDR